ncbi:hypothetical protein ACHRVZ_15850 [Flavobacterium sp. FlaQc-57]|uniref:hypothetical protein n=1 Tax=Flavobacterium sp. FlaQc-57 TaxID=3374186 RepID=UPI003756D281
MRGIILGLILAIITVLRSFENVVTNKRIISKLNKFYTKSGLYIKEISNSTYETASKEILIKTIKYLILYWGVICLLSFFILGLMSKINNVVNAFVASEILFLGIIFVLFQTLRFGIIYDLKKIKILLKKETITLLTSIETRIIIFFVYAIIVLAIYFPLEILRRHFHLSGNQILKMLLSSDLIYLFFGIILISPILLLLISVAILIFLYFCVWALSRLFSIISYWLLKWIFKACLFLNDEIPLKPLLLISQILIIIITPIVVFIVNIFL